MLEMLKQKSMVRVLAFVLLLTMVAWLLPAKMQESHAATTMPKNPVTASNGTVTWDCVYFGNYPQSSDGKGGFKTEPIKWRVLSVDGNDAFLLADENLDAKKYNDSRANVSWATCTIRNWLNGYGSSSNNSFLNTAFTSAEQNAILETEVKTANNPTYGTDGGKDTQDRVFLLSLSEAMTTAYGFPKGATMTANRASFNTDYAEHNGAWTYGGIGYWSLRSPGDRPAYVSYVNYNGYPNDTGYWVDNLMYHAVRPALHLDLSSNVWTYAGTVKSDEVMKKVGGKTTDRASGGTYEVVSTGANGGTVKYEAPLDKNASSATIPPTILIAGKDYKVTAVAKNAFKNNKKLKTVKLSDNVETIGADAFHGCTNLSNVTMGKNISLIGKNAFMNCTKLKDVTIPAKVKQINSKAFYGCKNLKKVAIKTKNLKSKKVGKNAFKKLSTKAVIKVPKEKLKAYKKLLQSKGLNTKITIK